MHTLPIQIRRWFTGLALLALPVLQAHETGGTPHEHVLNPVDLPFVTEQRGPVRVPRTRDAAGRRLSGQGYWKFTPVTGAVPVPPEAQPKLQGAHGTLVADPATDTVYWGLQDVGWIAFTERLMRSEIVEQDAAFRKGNLHGADLLPRRGQKPLVVAADNVEGDIYLSDTSFQAPQKLRIPEGEPYADGKGWAPTDAAFAGPDEVWVTDGYGKAWFMPASVEPYRYRGEFLGGKKVSNTPHGITHDARRGELYLSARPEAQIREFSLATRQWLAVHQLPKGSTVCDVDLWGDYLLAPCLDGPDKTPGPIYIVNIRTGAIVSTIKPKEELGYATADHIHDACWYVVRKGLRREVYVVFTAWNPGGIGAVKLVNVAD